MISEISYAVAAAKDILDETQKGIWSDTERLLATELSVLMAERDSALVRVKKLEEALQWVSNFSYIHEDTEAEMYVRRIAETARAALAESGGG